MGRTGMRTWWLVAAIAGVTAGAVASCGDTGSAFACQGDAECETPEAIGTCQANGYCSFPDAACPSGQRYGDLAGGGFAGMCVEPLVATGGVDSATEDSAASSASSGGPALTTSADEASTGSVDPSTTAGESTNGPSDCAGTFVSDDFADGVIDDLWTQVLPEHLAEGPLGLELTVTGDVSDGYPQVWPLPYPWNLDGGWLRVHVSQPPANPGEQLFISVYNDGGTLGRAINGPDVSASYDPDGMGSVLAGSEPYDPNVHQWLQLRFDNGMVFWETSPDGVSFQELASVELDVAPQTLTPTITGGNYLDYAGEHVVAVDAFEMCAP